MTRATPAPAHPDAHTAHTLERLLTEALSGPVNSGQYATLTHRGVVVDLAASAGWGLRMTRTLPDGRAEFRHLSGDQLSVDRAASAYQELLGS